MFSRPVEESLDALLRRYVEDETYSFEGFDVLSVHTKGREGETPLHMAVTRGALQDVRLLISGGADVNATTDIGMTPLHRAVFGNSTEIIELLLESGARLDIRDNYGQTPAQLALSHRRMDAYSVFTNHHGAS